VELKQIKELMTAMERAGIKKLSIKETTGFELQLERHEEASHAHPLPPPAPHYPVYHSHPFATKEAEPRFNSPPSTKAVEHESLQKKEEAKAGKYVTSPMVGTFYASPSPDDPPFVKVGDRVDENTIVCIIEAMKVMNEVKAGMSGIIEEILVDNAHPVEFGSKLFRIV